MARLVLRRVLLGVFTLWLVSVLIFAATQILPGDVASAILGQNATPQSLAALRHDLGLDRPAMARYVAWLAGFVTGDLGTSLASQQPVADLLWPRFWNTMALAAYAAVAGIPLAIGLGILTAVRRGGPFDRVVNILALAAVSLPEYFLGLLLILYFSVRTDLLPSLADVYPGMGFAAWLQATTLPMLTLMLVTVAQIMRMTRTAVLGVTDQAYIETAYLKGLRTRCRMRRRRSSMSWPSTSPTSSPAWCWWRRCSTITASAGSWWMRWPSATCQWCRPPPWCSGPPMCCST